MCDWNNNGKYDMLDAFISYHIYRSMSQKTSNDTGSSADGNAVLTVVGVVLLILGVFIFFA